MNKMLRRKKTQAPYHPKKRAPRKRVRRVWDGVVTDTDRYWAAHDPRQLPFAFNPVQANVDAAA